MARVHDSEPQGREGTYRLSLETLDEDAVEEGDDRLDALERRLGSLRANSSALALYAPHTTLQTHH